MVAFIGNSSGSLSGERGRPPHDEVIVSICAADFVRIWANVRQWWIILAGDAFWPGNASYGDSPPLTSCV
jgi:hypothetical protein